MTLDELKREAAVLTSEERLRLGAFLKHLERVDTVGNRAIDTGDQVTLEQWRKVHVALELEGL